MMKMIAKRMLAVSALALSLAACEGDDDTTTIDAGAAPDAPLETPDAKPTTYTPFSASNMEAQQARVGLYQEIAAIRKDKAFDKTKCGDLAGTPAAGTLAEVYTRADATAGVLRDKVKGRKDDHSYNAGATLGVTMDEVISKALADCHAGTLEAKLAGQLVDKTLQWFFYASVYHELVETLKAAEPGEKWDEAFGYYGRSPDGTASNGIAGTAAKRDTDYGLTLNNTIYDLFISGRDKVASKDTTGMTTSGEDIDKNLLLIFAYSTAREFVELPGAATDLDKAVKLAEGKAFFQIIEPYLEHSAKADADAIRAEIDKFDLAKPETVKDINASDIVKKIETAFGIDVTK
jgi:hypothetical protein